MRAVVAVAVLPLVGCSLLFAPSNDGPAPDENGSAADAAREERDAVVAPVSDAGSPSSPADTGAPATCRDDIAPKMSILGTAGACGGPSLPISLRRGLAIQMQGYNVGGCILADFGVPIPALEVVGTVETTGPCGTCSPSPCSSSSMDVYAWRTSPEDAEMAAKFEEIGTSMVPFVVTLPFETPKVAVCVARAGTALRVSAIKAVCR